MAGWSPRITSTKYYGKGLSYAPEYPGIKEPRQGGASSKLHWSKLRAHKVVTTQRVQSDAPTSLLEQSLSLVATEVLVPSAHPISGTW